MVAGALVGGALLGRLGTWAQHWDLRGNATLPEQWLYGNRSILSGLVGAYLGWKYLSVEREADGSDDVEIDFALSGPTLGVSFAF